MFDNERYITRGVGAEIPLWLQNLMWLALDTMEVDQKDYLQVFTLSSDGGKQKIVHTQEEPPYEHEYIINTDRGLTVKVFVIDDDDHTTMLLAEEY